jgi:hypothetical protein
MLIVDHRGGIRCLYSESVDLLSLGALSIQRASHVEPDEHGAWWADMAPVQGPKLGPFPRRSVALAAEQLWLEASLAGASQQPRS